MNLLRLIISCFICVLILSIQSIAIGIEQKTYKETFESGMGFWEKGVGSHSNYNWIRRNAETPSVSTGPGPGVGSPYGAESSSYYVFTEASPPPANSVTYLELDLADLEGENKVFKTIAFWYHRRSVNEGSYLYEDMGPSYLEEYYSGAWHTVWSRTTKNDGDTWYQVTAIDLNAATEKLRFRQHNGVANPEGFKSDASYDSIEIKYETLTYSVLYQLRNHMQVKREKRWVRF